VSRATGEGDQASLHAPPTRRIRSRNAGYATRQWTLVAALAAPYSSRRPTGTVLYGLVRQHVESFVAHAREHYEGGHRVLPDVPVRQWPSPATTGLGIASAHGSTFARSFRRHAVRQWQRLHEGLLVAAAPYIDWATLMRRTFNEDVLACARCGGRLRVLAVITEAEPVRRILEHLGLPSEAPPLARARDPTDEVEGADLGV